MRYKHINNGSKNLIIIFQSAGRLPIDILDKILNQSISEKEVLEYHQKYNWLNISSKMKCDFLYLEDYYSKSYGWYMVDSGESIIEKLNSELTEFIKKWGYNHVTTFGSSKGGSGALLYGLINENINSVFTLVPQINMVQYINKYMAKYKKLLFPNDNLEFEKKINNIFYDENIYKTKKQCSIYMYTGISDGEFNETLKLDNLFRKHSLNSNLIINISEKRHTPLVKDNIEFIYKMLGAIVNKSRIDEDRLIKIARGKFLLKDK